MSEAEMVARVESIIASERALFPITDVSITVQVGSLAEHGTDRLGATFGPPDSDAREALIVIDPRAFTNEAGIEHIVRHELVHVAHGVHFGDDREAALEWLVDEVARLVHEHRVLGSDVNAAADLLRAKGYAVTPPSCAECHGRGFIFTPCGDGRGVGTTSCPRGCVMMTYNGPQQLTAG